MARTEYLSELRQDVGYAGRTLRRAPGFTAAATLTLALGIGAMTSVFTVANGVLLQPLAFDDPDRLVGVWHMAPGTNTFEINSDIPLYFTYRDENRVFEDIGAWDPAAVTVTGLSEPAQVPAMRVTAGLLPLLRVQPERGRVFSELDDAPESPQTIMLSHAYWRQALGMDPAVVGTTLRVDGTQREVIGVLPADFVLPGEPASIYLPFQWATASLFVGNFQGGQAVARLLPGVTIPQANADVARMIPLALERFPGPRLAVLQEIQFGPNIRPFANDFVGDIGNVLWVLVGAVAIVFLVACANVANLFAVRAEARQREVAIRAAIGASRRRIVRFFLAEGLVLGGLGGVVGLALAAGGLRFITRLGPERLPRFEQIAVDGTVVTFTLGASIVAGLFFGSVPVWRLGDESLATGLTEGARGGGGGEGRQRTRQALVVLQTAMALVLLVGSGLMVRSFVALRGVDPGFSAPEEVLTFRLTIPAAEIQDDAEVVLAYEEISRRLSDTPGVVAVGASSGLTLGRYGSRWAIYVEDQPGSPDEAPPIRATRFITGGYFDAMRNPVLFGRAIEWEDIRERARVSVVTQNLAEEFWGQAPAALGKRVAWGNPDDLTEIVGVVGNVHENGLDQPATPVVFGPMAMVGTPGLVVSRSLSFAVRARTAPTDLVPAVRDVVRSVNPNLPLSEILTLDEMHTRSLARTSFALTLIALAAAVALVLGVVGIYGVVSYVVSQRRREIGIRMALGAQRANVSRMVLREGAMLVAVGIALGLVSATGLTRLMASLLFGVQATDPLTFASVSALLGAVALLATYLPARRASGTDPVQALRLE